MGKKIRFTEAVLRDGQQDLIATRMPTSDILPTIKTMDETGFHTLEVWGGATSNSCVYYLNEDPQGRLRQIHREVKNTKLQMLLQGQNLLGYRYYADDVMWALVGRSIEDEVDIIRILDALNDVRNLQTATQATKEADGHRQAAISYTTSEIHTIDYSIKLTKELSQTGADLIRIKDMISVLMPQTDFELVSKMGDAINLPLEVHMHATSGISEITYLKVAEAGTNIVNIAISSFADGTDQPVTGSVAIALGDSGFETGLDAEKIAEIADYLSPICNRFKGKGILSPRAEDMEPKTLIYQVPGGMLSNSLNQLMK